MTVNGRLCIRVTSEKCQSHWARDAGKYLIYLRKRANILFVWLRIRLFTSRNLEVVKINHVFMYSETWISHLRKRANVQLLSVLFRNRPFATLDPHFVFTKTLSWDHVLYFWECCILEKYDRFALLQRQIYKSNLLRNARKIYLRELCELQLGVQALVTPEITFPSTFLQMLHQEFYT